MRDEWIRISPDGDKPKWARAWSGDGRPFLECIDPGRLSELPEEEEEEWDQPAPAPAPARQREPEPEPEPEPDAQALDLDALPPPPPLEELVAMQQQNGQADADDEGTGEPAREWQVNLADTGGQANASCSSLCVCAKFACE